MLPRLIRFLPVWSLILTLLLTGCAPGESEALPSSENSNAEEEPEVTGEPEELEDVATSQEAAPDSSCVPDCENKFCGQDGCGELCGVCASGYQCTDDFQCELFCLDKVDKECAGTLVFWVNDCGETTTIAETCTPDTQCVDGACVPCEIGEETTCFEGNPYRVDVCGNRADPLEPCASNEVCFEGACFEGETESSGEFWVTITPEEWNYETGVSTLLGSAKVNLLVTEAGTATLILEEGVLSLSGFFSEDQIQLQGEWSGPLPEGIVSRSFLLQGLPLSLDSFKGTIREFVLLDGEEKPSDSLREYSAERVD